MNGGVSKMLSPEDAHKLLWIFLIIGLAASACKQDPCARSHSKRPGWDLGANAPELPYLPPPGTAFGCSSAKSGSSSLGCPELLNGDMPLSANLDFGHRPRGRPHYQVYLLTSLDGQKWNLEPEPILHSFSSLGLWIEENTLYLFGSSQIPLFTPYAVIAAVQTSDLETWEGCAWNICSEVNKGLVDTQPALLPDGTIRMWYYSVPNPPGRASFDPAQLQGLHQIAFADFRDGFFFARGVGIAATDLADPSVVKFRDRWWMAVSQSARRALVVRSTDGERFESSGVSFEDVSVPHLFVLDDALWLLAQRYVDTTGPWPYLFVSRNGKDWEDRGFVVRDRPATGCTSPVMGRFQGRYVMFCASLVQE